MITIKNLNKFTIEFAPEKFLDTKMTYTINGVEIGVFRSEK